MNKKLINSALNCEAFSSFQNVSTNHRIVTAKICLNLHRNATQTAKTTLYDWPLLNNKDISNKYTITQRNKFDTLLEISETHTPNDEYENFINAHIEAAAECIPTKEQKKKSS